MPQQFLPFIAPGATVISKIVSVFCEDETWTYFHGGYPIFYHKADDKKMFRLLSAQLVVSGSCRQVDIIKTFGVSKNSVIRSTNKLREGGSEAFFQPRKGRRRGTVLTPEVLKRAQKLLDQRYSRRDISKELNVPYDTLRKAINQGRLHEHKSLATPGTTKSSRNTFRTLDLQLKTLSRLSPNIT